MAKENVTEHLSTSRSSRLAAASILRPSVADQQRFAGLLLDPPTPTPAMKRAQKAHAKLIESQ